MIWEFEWKSNKYLAYERYIDIGLPIGLPHFKRLKEISMNSVGY